jgi:hypothetical protein
MQARTIQNLHAWSISDIFTVGTRKRVNGVLGNFRGSDPVRQQAAGDLQKTVHFRNDTPVNPFPVNGVPRTSVSAIQIGMTPGCVSSV